MSYKVLARKWRPRSFAEVAGQEHVIRTLSNAIELSRMHHAYLFAGTRGVGKTTIARILARCLNCETGPTANPCGKCAACREIDDGRFVDLIEVDAASRTGVENMREILDNVQYAPSRGRYKIYLIDEVHMLSVSSFNALLKTLEEPPDHIKFLFATTNPQKIPATVLSRCLQLNLTRLPKQTILEYLRKLLEDEDIACEDSAPDKIVIAAEGSMRDALSLLDQAIAYGNGALKTDAVYEMLGLSDRESTVRILQRITQGDAAGMLQIVDELYRNAADFSGVLKDFIDLLHRIALHQTLPDAEPSPHFAAADIKALAEAMAAEDIQLAYQTALSGKRDMPLVGDDKNAIEMTFLRIMNFIPLQSAPAAQAAAPATPAAKPRQATTPKAETTAPQATTPKAETTAPQATPPKAEATAAEAGTASADAPTSGATPAADLRDYDGAEGWGKLIEQMALSGHLRGLCYQALLIADAPTAARLQMDESTAELCSDKNRQAIREALNRAVGAEVDLQFTVADETTSPAQLQKQNAARQQHQAQAAFDQDPDVALIKKEFNASTLPDSVRPTKTEN